MPDSTYTIHEIISVDIRTLATVVAIASVETVGIVQFLKNFFRRKNGGPKTNYAIVSFAVCVICGAMNTTLLPPLATAIFDIIMLSLAVVQTAWDVIAKKLPEFIGAFFDKISSMPISREKE
ncbi:MAG: hypothetical protein LBK61_05305 [Spirochaetaceae bacterium]|nr:hypothetical protein [Spirochaetaceae bacterium]